MKWRTRYGFYLVAMGSAFGLGNLWRFPYIVSDNGGGAFVLLYIILALAVGLPLLIGELILGRSLRLPVLPATQNLQKGQYAWVGRLSFAISLLVLSYYAVISGWVLYFVIQFATETVLPHFPGADVSLRGLTDNAFLQIGLASVHLILCTVICARGVQEGIERWIGSIMPIFILLLGYLLYQSLSLPTVPDAFRFLFYPNFSALTLSSLGSALGHVFFTLGLGLGCMVTFGSYMIDQEHIPTAGFRVTVLDTMLSLVAGLLVIPIALSASTVPLNDPGLLFEALPVFLIDQPGGTIFGLAFFICLYVSALGASLGLLEVIVANSSWVFKVPRAKSAWLAGTLVLALSTVPVLMGVFFSESLGRTSSVEILDSFLINWLLPLACLSMSLAIVWGRKKSELESEFTGSAHGAERAEGRALFSHWRFALKWGIPTLVTLGLALQLLKILRG